MHTIVTQLSNGTRLFDQSDLAAAKCGVIFAAISRESNLSDAARQNFINIVLKKLGKNPVKKYLSRVNDVTVDDLKRVLEMYVEPIFGGKAVVAVAASPGKAEELIGNFGRSGLSMRGVESVDRLIDGWEKYVGEEEEEDSDSGSETDGSESDSEGESESGSESESEQR